MQTNEITIQGELGTTHSIRDVLRHDGATNKLCEGA